MTTQQGLIMSRTQRDMPSRCEAMSSSPSRVRSMLYRATCKLPLRLRRQVLYARHQRRLLNLRNPERFTEKVNWRIVRDRRELLAWTCDKQRYRRAGPGGDREARRRRLGQPGGQRALHRG